MNLKKEVTYLIEQVRDFHYWNRLSSIPNYIQDTLCFCISYHFEKDKDNQVDDGEVYRKGNWFYLKMNRFGKISIVKVSFSKLIFYSSSSPCLDLEELKQVEIGSIEDQNIVQLFYNFCEKEQIDTTLLEHFYQHDYSSAGMIMMEEVQNWLQQTPEVYLSAGEIHDFLSLYRLFSPFSEANEQLTYLFYLTDLIDSKNGQEVFNKIRRYIVGYDLMVGSRTEMKGGIVCLPRIMSFLHM